MYVVQSGKLNVYITQPDGSTLSLKVVKTGESVTSLLSFIDVLFVRNAFATTFELLTASLYSSEQPEPVQDRIGESTCGHNRGQAADVGVSRNIPRIPGNIHTCHAGHHGPTAEGDFYSPPPVSGSLVGVDESGKPKHEKI